MPATLSSTPKASKAPKGSKIKAVKPQTKATRPPTPSEPSDSENSDSDYDGVDEKGMNRLVNALGDDALDEFDQAQLRIVLGDSEDEDDEEEDEEGEGEVASQGEDSEDEDASVEDSEAEVDDEDEEEGEENEDDGDAAEEQSDAEEDEEIALDEIENADIDEDAVPQQKVQIDDTVALDRIRETIQLDPSLPWTETLVVTYPESIDVDVSDDLNRELAFYKQALHGANLARSLAAKHKLPFTRPSDYFAEMVKSDAHMERIRQRLLDETAGIKKSEEKRKEREGKKFGKQVQLEKQKERQKGRKEMEERLKGLKRKRGDVLDKPNDDDGFDVAVEDAISDRPAKKNKTQISRKARDQKYGFGGARRHSKQNTRESTDSFISSSRGKGRHGAARGGARGGPKRNSGGSKRPGKDKRIAARSKR